MLYCDVCAGTYLLPVWGLPRTRGVCFVCRHHEMCTDGPDVPLPPPDPPPPPPPHPSLAHPDSPAYHLWLEAGSPPPEGAA